MADRPIIFSAPMVRALLEGRKTQTRRVLSPQPELFKVEGGMDCDVGLIHVEGRERPNLRLGHVITRQHIRYAIGDRLWVREAVARIDNSEFGQPSYWEYRADTNGRDFPGDWPPEFKDDPDRPRWRPSIHMPREASRMLLIVEGVKVERLNSISEEDARAEGCKLVREHCNVFEGTAYDRAGLCHSSPVTAFATLWDELHGNGSWEKNPFVVAITFRVIKANIDAPEALAA